jgi:hypothetical protein
VKKGEGLNGWGGVLGSDLQYSSMRYGKDGGIQGWEFGRGVHVASREQCFCISGIIAFPLINCTVHDGYTMREGKYRRLFTLCIRQGS